MSELSYEEKKLDLRLTTEVKSMEFGGWLKIIR